MFAASYFGQSYFGQGPTSATGTTPAKPTGLPGTVTAATPIVS